MRVDVRVTWRDIWEGRAGNPALCPVACALQRQVNVGRDFTDPGWRQVLVGGGHVEVLRASDGTYHNVPLPRRVSGFVLLFDNLPRLRLLRVALLWPFSFRLELPE